MLIVGTMVVGAALGLARFGYSTVLPAMQEGIGLDNTQAGVIATANLFGYLMLAAIGGALASRLGPRVVIAAGLTLAGLSMLLTGMVSSFAGATFWRLLTGIGSGASYVPVMGLMAAWFSARRRGLAAGILVSGSSFVLIVIGPSVPAVLNAYGDMGWRVCWWGFGTLVLIIAMIAALLLRNCPEDCGLRPVVEDTSGNGERARAGLKWGAVYRARSVWHLGAVYFPHGFSYIIYLTFFVAILVQEAGYTEAAAGNLFMLVGWLSLACGIIWGHVSDVLGRGPALMIVYLIHVVAFAIFGLTASPVALTISAILFGLTAWSIPAIMSAASGDIVGPKLAPAALGFATLFFGVGQAAAPTVAGAVADAVGSLRLAMLLAAGVALMGAIGAATLRMKVQGRT